MSLILVVDDEKGIREFLAEALTDAGHTVVCAADGPEALALLRARAYDLMITDLRMPGSPDGMELLRRARADLPNLEVVVLTAHGSVNTAVEAMKLGAFDYLQKPLSGPGELRLLAARALERRQLRTLKDRSTQEAQASPPLSYGDPTMAAVVDALDRVAPTAATVLLLGESGTGKELAARAVHQRSPRADGPFVPVNCAAITDTLMESEIFGHEKGAFTGATAQRRGRLELADGGTLFLDEIGELKPELQAKLLRVLQERCFERLGSSRTIQVDVRWIAATNRDIDTMVRAGTFREDLYHRLAVFPLRLPPLRDRPRDILPLATTLLARIAVELGRPPLRLDDSAKRWIETQPWPGNIRQLANTLERAAILTDADLIRQHELALEPTAPTAGAPTARTMAEIEREAIQAALAEAGGNRRQTATRLGIGLRTLYEKLRRYGID